LHIIFLNSLLTQFLPPALSIIRRNCFDDRLMDAGAV
jgi:hypothetical protein